MGQKEKNKTSSFVIMGFIAIALLIVSIFVTNVSTYAFMGSLFMVGFMIFIKLTENIPEFTFIDYNNVIANKFFNDARTTFRGEIKGIYLTGENIFPYKKIADCIAYFTYSFDIFKTKIEEVLNPKTKKMYEKIVKDLDKKGSLEIYGFFYYVFDMNFMIKFLQKTIPNIPIIKNIFKKIPLINNYCFPTVRGIITTEDRIDIKKDIVEIRGKSLMPLSIKEDFNVFSIVEYSGKFEETRNMERYIFSKEINQDFINSISNFCKNSMEIATQLNPQVKVEQEKSIMKK